MVYSSVKEPTLHNRQAGPLLSRERTAFFYGIEGRCEIALYQVVAGNTIQSADVNQVVNVLQQPSGGQEAGVYYLGGWGAANNDLISMFIISRSRGSTPISVTVDSSLQALFHMNALNTNLQSSGFQIWSSASGNSGNCHSSGQWTIQF